MGPTDFDTAHSGARGLVCCWAGVLATIAVLLVPSSAVGQIVGSTAPASMSQPEPGFALTPAEARAIADRQALVRDERGAARARVVVPHYFGDRRYEVVYLDDGDVRLDVHVDGRTGRVLEAWSGPQATNLLARGYDPPIGRSLNKPYLWIGLALLFLAPFVDPRKPFRLLHLDLVVLLSFGVSLVFFNRGDIDLSVPLVYPVLGYLLARMLVLGFRPRGAQRGALIPWLSPKLLAVGLVALVALRLGLNLSDSHAIDVGQESVFGADRILHGEDLYARDGEHGDTYGPIAYLAYVPFVALFPIDGAGGFEYAARSAAISFDLLAIVGLLLLGAKLRPGRDGRILGLALAYAWAAYPFSTYVLQANTNDALVAALITFSFITISSATRSGALLGLAGAAKFTPLALVPLLARGAKPTASWRHTTAFGLAALATMTAALALYLPDGGIAETFHETIGFQLGRESPFALWGLHPSLGWLHSMLTAATLALIVVVAFRPRRPQLPPLAALGAAVLISQQLIGTHWFYTYLVWFLPLLLAALFSHHRTQPATAARRGRAQASANP